MRSRTGCAPVLSTSMKARRLGRLMLACHDAGGEVSTDARGAAAGTGGRDGRAGSGAVRRISC
jgi:hypothetical protein